MPTYTEVSRAEVMALLGPHRFTPVEIEGTRELVLGKRVDRRGVQMTLRVYTSIDGEASRGVGEDAIRVCLVTRRADGKIVGIGRARRVNRVPSWGDRLLQRIARWQDLLGPDCPKCGRPVALRRGKRGEFWGCVDYPACTGTVDAAKTKAQP